MKIKQRIADFSISASLASTLILFCVSIALAQTTAFNFQGRLNDGSSPANGKYDLEFRLYDAPTDGEKTGSTIRKLSLTLINGVFSTTLDFGLRAFDGDNRYLEISLRPTDSENPFVILGPRQKILAVPYTIRSLRATLAEDATHAVSADSAVNATNLGGTPAAKYLKTDGDGNAGIGGTDPDPFPGRLYVKGIEGLGGTGTAIHAVGRSIFDGDVSVKGNLTQPLTSNGLPKAIVRADRDGHITSCYNGITGESSNNCGFSVVHSYIGDYEFYFGFDVGNRVLSVVSEFDDGNTETFVYQKTGQLIDIIVTYPGYGNPTNAPVNIVVY